MTHITMPGNTIQ